MDAQLKAWLIVGSLFSGIVSVSAEEITIVTYYPSPRGVYEELRASGDVGIGAITAPGARLHVTQQGVADAVRVDDEAADGTPFVIDQDGNVGIKTGLPVTPLDVGGGIKIGNWAACNATYSGTLRSKPTVAGSELYYCNGVDWIPLITSTAPCAPVGDSYTTNYSQCSCGAGTFIWEGIQTCTCAADGNWSCVPTCTPPPAGAPPPPCPPWY